MLNIEELGKETIEEIISVSNHDSEESVFEASELGILEVYPNRESYLDAGWNFENEDCFEILSDGKAVYFVN